MSVLLDSHLLLWIAGAPDRVPREVLDLIRDEHTTLCFSAANIWEIAIKSGLGRPDFKLDPAVFRQNFLDRGYHEISVTGAHAAAVQRLPPIHKDPFDRMLVAQAQLQKMTLYTSDVTVACYPGPIIRV